MKFLRPALIVGALPVTLTNGTTADATQVMADLNWIINQVNANAAPLATAALTNANNNFTTVQSGQAATQPANFPIASQVQNQAFNTLSSVLGTNTITARVSSLTLSAYATGQIFTFLPSNANTGAATVNIDGVGARSILNMGSGLSGAELQTYRPAVIAYDPNFNAFDLLNGTPYVQGPNLPAAATLNLDGQFGDYHQVDGTANITSLTLSRGRQKLLEFTSSPLLSHSASLILGSNITPNPGDVLAFRGEAGGIARLVSAIQPTASLMSVQKTITNSLVADVALNNTGTYFDGPSVAQGTQGTFFASGTVTLVDTAGIAEMQARLWDGTTVIASTRTTAFGANRQVSLSLSGFIKSPAGNIRISVNDASSTSGKIEFNATGDSKDSTITVVRVA